MRDPRWGAAASIRRASDSSGSASLPKIAIIRRTQMSKDADQTLAPGNGGSGGVCNQTLSEIADHQTAGTLHRRHVPPAGRCRSSRHRCGTQPGDRGARAAIPRRACGKQFPFGTKYRAAEMAQPILSGVAFASEDRLAAPRVRTRRATLNGSTQSAPSLLRPTQLTEPVAIGRRKTDARTCRTI